MTPFAVNAVLAGALVVARAVLGCVFRSQSPAASSPVAAVESDGRRADPRPPAAVANPDDVDPERVAWADRTFSKAFGDNA